MEGGTLLLLFLFFLAKIRVFSVWVSLLEGSGFVGKPILLREFLT